MASYILRRLLLIVPTLLGIMILNFGIVQLAPGGPVEQMIAKAHGQGNAAVSRISSDSDAGAAPVSSGKYRGDQGLDPAVIAAIEKDFGFDKPFAKRFALMMRHYATFDFGESYFQNRRVIDLVKEKLPVSISLGLWTTLLIYGISIPLGIAKAVRSGSRFDAWSSILIVFGYAIPSYLFAILLIELFAGGSFLHLFPFRGIHSENWSGLPWRRRIADYAWHMALPVTAMVIGGFASLTMLTRNSFLDEIGKQYVLTARAKGLKPARVLYGHVFRNAMLIVIAGFPAAFIAVLFTGSLLTEIIFSLDGLGLLGYQATLARDYPIMFATLYIYTLIGLALNLLSDLMYVIVDPRIDFAER